MVKQYRTVILFSYLDLTITSAKDIPMGAEDFVNTLVDIGVPKAYIQLPRRSPRKTEWVKF